MGVFMFVTGLAVLYTAQALPLSSTELECMGYLPENCTYLRELNQQIRTYGLSEFSPQTKPPVEDGGAITLSAFGDIILSIEQSEALLRKLHKHKKRRKRKIEILSVPVRKWPLPIKYKYHPLYTFGDTYKRQIRGVLRHWEEHTCIRFQEIDVDVNVTEPHLQFVFSIGCASHLGRSTEVIPQLVQFSPNCLSKLGAAAHEIGHTLGMVHEHQRLDRQRYVTIQEENIKAGLEGNFMIWASDLVEDLGVPYDYASALHYGPWAFTNGKGPTIQAIDTPYKTTYGQSAALSFMDTKIVNLAYCKDKCANHTTQCRNGGYSDPNNCTRCRCPDGFAGERCQTVPPSSGKICGGVLTARKSVDQAGLSSDSDYPYDDFQSCTWHIQAPNGYHVMLKFVGSFGIYSFGSQCTHYVEVRYRERLDMTGPRFCGLQAPGSMFVSAGNRLVVLFRSPAPITSSSNPRIKKGFRFQYSAGKIDGNIIFLIPRISVNLDLQGDFIDHLLNHTQRASGSNSQYGVTLYTSFSSSVVIPLISYRAATRLIKDGQVRSHIRRKLAGDPNTSDTYRLHTALISARRQLIAGSDRNSTANKSTCVLFINNQTEIDNATLSELRQFRNENRTIIVVLIDRDWHPEMVRVSGIRTECVIRVDSVERLLTTAALDVLTDTIRESVATVLGSEENITTIYYNDVITTSPTFSVASTEDLSPARSASLESATDSFVSHHHTESSVPSPAVSPTSHSSGAHVHVTSPTTISESDDVISSSYVSTQKQSPLTADTTSRGPHADKGATTSRAVLSDSLTVSSGAKAAVDVFSLGLMVTLHQCLSVLWY